MKILVAGDIVATRSLRPHLEAGALRALQALCGDLFVANVETPFHDYGFPAAGASGGTYLAAPQQLAVELRELGLSVACVANNHFNDYGPAGVEASLATLRDAGIVPIGAGQQEQARSAKLVNVAGTTIAFIAASSTLPVGSAETRAIDGIPGRPGVNPLRFDKRYTLPPESFSALQEIAKRCYFDKLRDPERVTIEPHSFQRGDDWGVGSSPDATDLGEICAAVENARASAEAVIVSLHSHEAEGNWECPPEFLVAAAHDLVDAGASVIFCHGPHLIRGVELYRDAVIMYSLGSLFFQNFAVAYPEDLRRNLGLPVDASVDQVNAAKFDFSSDDRFWETVVALIDIESEGYPHASYIPFGVARHGDSLGLPYRAHGELAARILSRFKALSDDFGTQLVIENDVAILEGQQKPTGHARKVMPFSEGAAGRVGTGRGGSGSRG
jgi:poly-gamma-glutamate capsule biosynthesis protein CapA/YwtB (metallophosphatase superfamily)